MDRETNGNWLVSVMLLLRKFDTNGGYSVVVLARLTVNQEAPGSIPASRPLFGVL